MYKNNLFYLTNKIINLLKTLKKYKKPEMYVYALFLDKILYNIYENEQDALNDCRVMKESALTLTILVKEYTLVKSRLYPYN